MSARLPLILLLASCAPPNASTDSEDTGLQASVGSPFELRREGSLTEVFSGETPLLVSRFTSWGRSGTPADLAEADEWWRILPYGAEQGWTLARAPAGSGEIAFDVAFDGATAIAPTHFTDATGRPWSVGAPHAWDALGRSLPTHIEATGAGLRIRVSDRGAIYPVVVDPIYSTASSIITGNSGDTLGSGLALLGDVNGDGFDDLAAGGESAAGLLGQVWVYRGSAAGIATSASTTITGQLAGGGLGGGLAAAGDVNDDGYADLLIAARGTLSGTGSVYVHHGSSNGTIPAASTTLAGTWAGDSFGASLAGGGDVNGDGFDDVIIGASGMDSGAGRAYLYYGSSSGIPTTASLSWAGSVCGGTGFGGSATIAGDLNGDTYADLAIGAVGTVCVWYGAATFPSPSPDLVLTHTVPDFGSIVVGAGDVNGDTYADLAISASDLVAIYHGSATGIPSLSSLELTPSLTGTGFGASMARAGDTDADGFDDLIVGSPSFSSNTGQAGLYMGSATGLSTSPLTTVVGPANSSLFGTQATGGGDVDGDGFSDVSVSAPGYAVNRGQVYVYRGYRDDDNDGILATEDCDDDDPMVGGPSNWFQDADSDGFGNLAVVRSACDLPLGYLATGGDCDDRDPDIRPGAQDVVADGVDANCDGVETCYQDLDGDRYRTDLTVISWNPDCVETGEALSNIPDGDCDDSNISFHPNAREPDCDDPNDYNCDGTVVFRDDDLDGWAACLECDDANPVAWPGATEIVGNEVDESCDNQETCYQDQDRDGYRTDQTINSADLDCNGSGEAPATMPDGDCDDRDAIYNPGATEPDCTDPNDYDCDGSVVYADTDRDGFANCVDCDPMEGGIFPGAEEVPGDQVDQDCDSTELCFTDTDADGFRSDATMASADLVCTDPGEAPATLADGDCDDADNTMYPGAPEVLADGIDQDCNGEETCHTDTDLDGYRSEDTLLSTDPDCEDPGEALAADRAGDCDDSDAGVHPSAPESIGDAIDVDCDGAELCFADADDDGWRLMNTVDSKDMDCTDPGEAETTDPTTDCNDTDPTIHPDAKEIVGDEIDQDCDGVDPDLPDTGKTWENDTGEGKDGDCGCSSGRGSGMAWILAMALALVGRRRK